jgi:saccharopine dehydrogenase (NADP+, L-glutamate forming)
LPHLKTDADEATRILHGLKWLGLFSSEPCTRRNNPLDSLCATLGKLMQYGPGERDMVFLQHRFECEIDGKHDVRTSTGVWYGEPNGFTAMARTVGVPCGIATQLVLDGGFTFSIFFFAKSNSREF